VKTVRLQERRYEPHPCENEEEVRELVKTLPEKGEWSCYFFKSDTTGEMK